MVWNKKLTVLLIGIIACVCSVQAQVKILRGVILDKQSDEPIPYASAVFKKSGAGVLSDSLGKFILELKSWPVGDTLVVNNVGYKPTLIPFTDIKDSASITIYIEVLPPQHEAVVKVKYNRALWFWRRIIAHKSKNDKHSLLISKTLGDIEEILPAEIFVRIHHSTIVNINAVTHYSRTDGGYVVMNTNEKLMVSKARKEVLLQRLGLMKS